MEEHKRKPLRYVSFCSGVEAASQAWGRLGWKAVAFSEIEPFPCAVLASRFPDVPNLGDMSKIHYDRNTKELTNGTVRVVCDGGIDLLVGGTPCQSFSVAGKRAGLEGASGLAYHYARLIGEIRPRWFVWENVPGALSSATYGDQRDFNFLLQQFAVGGDASLGCRWDLCWRVLDTQYVRVEHFSRAIPQRRRRVFVVGRLAADGGGGCEVLLEPEGVRGDTAPRRVKGQGVAGDPARGAGGADGEKRGIEAQSFDVLCSQNIAHCEKAYERAETCRRQDSCGVGVAISFKGGQSAAVGVKPGEIIRLSDRPSIEVQPTITRSDGKAGDNTPTVAIAYDGYNQRAWDEVSFTQRSAASGTEGNDADVKVAIATKNDVEAFASPQDHDIDRGHMTECAPTIGAAAGMSGNNMTTIAIGIGRTMDGANGQAVAFRSTSQFGQFKQDDVSGTLDCEHIGGVGNGTPALVATQGGGMRGWRTSNGEDVMPTLTNDLAKMVSNQQQRSGGYLCGPIQ